MEYLPHFEPNRTLQTIDNIKQALHNLNVHEMANFIKGCVTYFFPKKITFLITLRWIYKEEMSRDMRFSTMWYVQPAKAQTSLRVRAFASCLNNL